MKRWIIIILVVVVLVGGYFGYRAFQRQQAALNTNYQTVTLSRGSLTATIGATGTVRANQTAVLSWQTTGTVGQIDVKVGDQVAADEVLAELLQGSLSQTIISAEAELISAQRSLDNLRQSGVARAQAQQSLAAAQDALETAQKRLESKAYTRASQDVIDVAYANYILAQEEVDRRQSTYDGTAHLAEDDPVRASALSSLASARQKRDTALANYNYAKGMPDAIDIDIAAANAEVARANLDDAQREYDRLKDGTDPRDIAAAEARVAAIKATLDMAHITAPFGGTVTQVDALPGDQAAPGVTAFRIDDLSRLLVDVQITEVDINSIQIGQPVRLTFDAIPNKEYNGQISEVGQVGTAVQGVVNFTVTIELIDADENVRPGMTAAVNVVISQLEDVLLVPNRAVRLREGQRVVYLLRSGIPEAVEIELGATSETSSQIISGDVKEGDEVVLNPSNQLQPGGGFFGGPGGGGGGPVD